MIITGSIHEDYRFQIEHTDYGFVNRRFIDADSVNGMLTFPVYSKIPEYIVIGKKFDWQPAISVPGPKTMTPRTKTEFLLLHGLCVNIDNADIVPISSMVQADWKNISAKNGKIYANHIPGVFTITPDGVIKSINGKWDPERNVFVGSIEIGSLDGVVDEIIKS